MLAAFPFFKKASAPYLLLPAQKGRLATPTFKKARMLYVFNKEMLIIYRSCMQKGYHRQTIENSELEGAIKPCCF